MIETLKGLARPSAGWYALLAALGLGVLGIAAIDTVSADLAHRQGWLWLPAALVVMSACIVPHPRWLGQLAYPLFGAGLALLVYLIIPGAPRVPRINGAKAWLDLGVMNFQPSEMVKVTAVMALAWFLRYRSNYRTLGGLLGPFALMLVPVGLILKEPDLGSAMLFAPTLMVMLLAAGAKLRHLLTLGGLALIGLVLVITVIVVDPPHRRAATGHAALPGWTHVLASHQEKRIAALIWPQRYRRREAFQQIVATRLIGAGGWTGVGQRRASTLIDYNRLPEPHNDMIFAVIINRWGLLGGVLAVGLYLVLISSCLVVAGRSRDPFARLCCVGFGGMIFTQATINVAMCVGLLPVIGITLPLVSYGGSSLMFTFVMVGLVVNFASRRRTPMARPTFEFDRATTAAG